MEVKPRDLLQDKLKTCPIEHSGKPLPFALVREAMALVLQKLMDALVGATRLLKTTDVLQLNYT